GIVATVDPWLAVPSGEAVFENEAVVGGVPVELRERVAATEAEPADEPPGGSDVPGHASDQRRLRPRRREQRDVAGHDDKIERSPEFELAEVRPNPFDVR